MEPSRSSIIVAGVLTGLAVSQSNCYRPGSYACQGDADCVLAGGEGICTDLGHCAYPSELCQSGWKYPDGVPGALGGKCAVGPPPPGDTESTGSTTADTDPSTTTTTTSTSTGTGTSTGTEGVTATGTGTDTGGETDSDTDGPPTCQDPDAPDQPGDAPLLSLPACRIEVLNANDDVGDADWFHIQFPPSCADLVDGGLSGLDGRHCLYLGCVAMDLCVLNGNPDEDLLALGSSGCCREQIGMVGDVVIDTSVCPPGTPIYALVEPSEGNGTCEPYFFDIDASGD